MKRKEPKIGDRVRHSLYGTGTITEVDFVLDINNVSIALVNVYFDNGILTYTNLNTLTKSITKSPIKPKVKRWRWVYGTSNHLDLYITVDWYTEEEAKRELSAFLIIQKLDPTEKEFDE